MGTKKRVLCSLRDSTQDQQEWSWNKVSVMCEGTSGGLELCGLGYTQVQASSTENLVLPEVGCMGMCEFSAVDRQYPFHRSQVYADLVELMLTNLALLDPAQYVLFPGDCRMFKKNTQKEYLCQPCS